MFGTSAPFGSLASAVFVFLTIDTPGCSTVNGSAAHPLLTGPVLLASPL
jgi:hypothetical protein